MEQMERFNQHVKDWNCRNDVLHCINKSIDCYGDTDAVELKLLLNKTENFVKSYYGPKLQWHEFKNKKNPLLDASNQYGHVTQRHIEKDRLVAVGANDEKDEFICDGYDGRKWYYCHGQKVQRSAVDAKSLNHCGEQLGYDLLSLRDIININGVDYWKCYVTASLDRQEKVISQFKGVMNSKVESTYYHDLYRLIKFVYGQYGFEKISGIGYHDDRNTSIDELMVYFQNDLFAYKFLEPHSTYELFKKSLIRRYGKLKFKSDEDILRDVGVMDHAFMTRFLREKEMEPIRTDVLSYMRNHTFGFYEMLGTTENFQLMQKYVSYDESDCLWFSETLRTQCEFKKFVNAYGKSRIRKSALLRFIGWDYLKTLKELDLSEEQMLPFEMIKLYKRCTPSEKKEYKKHVRSGMTILNKEDLYVTLCGSPKEEYIKFIKVFGMADLCAERTANKMYINVGDE